MVAYDILTEINTQLKKRLHILTKSKKIFISFIAFPHNSVSVQMQKILSTVSDGFNNMLTSSKTSSDIGYTIYKLENNLILNTFENFHKEYQLLKKEKHQ